jgi:hypothetical protein
VRTRYFFSLLFTVGRCIPLLGTETKETAQRAAYLERPCSKAGHGDAVGGLSIARGLDG